MSGYYHSGVGLYVQDPLLPCPSCRGTGYLTVLRHPNSNFVGQLNANYEPTLLGNNNVSQASMPVWPVRQQNPEPEPEPDPPRFKRLNKKRRKAPADLRWSFSSSYDDDPPAPGSRMKCPCRFSCGRHRPKSQGVSRRNERYSGGQPAPCTDNADLSYDGPHYPFPVPYTPASQETQVADHFYSTDMRFFYPTQPNQPSSAPLPTDEDFPRSSAPGFFSEPFLSSFEGAASGPLAVQVEEPSSTDPPSVPVENPSSSHPFPAPFESPLQLTTEGRKHRTAGSDNIFNPFL